MLEVPRRPASPPCRYVMALALLVLSPGAARAQAASGVPDSVIAHMDQTVGVWITDNSAYQGDGEPYDHYGLEWTWGLDEKTLVGRLYGIVDGEDVGTFWEFRQFWHPGEKVVIVEQFGWGGVYGTGTMTWIEPGVSELVQTFYAPDGSSRRTRHVTRETATVHDGGSFDRVDGEWQERRSYVWYKQVE